MFYQKTRQRVRVPVDAALVAEAEEAVARAWDLANIRRDPAAAGRFAEVRRLLAQYDLPAGRDESAHEPSI